LNNDYRLLLEPEESFLECYATGGGETADFAVATDYPVAGDNQWQGVFSQCTGDGPATGWAPDFFCQFEITYCLTERDFSARC
jgi:hypothetical protein